MQLFSHLCKELGLCGLTEKINVSYSNSTEKNPCWWITGAFRYDCPKLVNKLTFSNLDNNVHLVTWTWSMSLGEVMLHAEGYFKLSHNKNTVSLLHENHKHTAGDFSVSMDHQPTTLHTAWSLIFPPREWCQNMAYHILDLIFICLKWIAWLVPIPAFPMFAIHSKNQTSAPVETEPGIWNLN